MRRARCASASSNSARTCSCTASGSETLCSFIASTTTRPTVASTLSACALWQAPRPSWTVLPSQR